MKYVEVAVEVRDVAPLVGDVVVDDRDALILAIILPRDIQIQLRQCIARDGLPLSRHFVHPEFELCKLRLAKYGALDVLEIIPQQRQPRVVVLRVLQDMVDQERLIKRGRDFCHEDRIVRERVRLRLIGEVALHRVSHLVGKRADVRVLPVVIDQHVRMDVIGGAFGIGARTLAFVREQIDPPAVVRALDRAGVFASERRDGFEDEFLRLLRRVGQFDRSDERRVQVVIMKLVQTENALAQLQVSMEGRKILADAIDEAHVDRHRNVRPVQRVLQSRFVLPRFGLK